jgi:pimeloyl-ACP methyl ester carboxylesterase
MSSTTTVTEAEEVERANASGKTPVVFIHGLWLLPSSWDRWATVFEEAGYAALTPGWPDDPETVAEANAHPEVFAHKTVGQVADHYAEVIGRLSKKPVVIGHSFGGLLTQIIAGRGLSAASVAVDPAPFRGVLPLPISALRSASPVLGNPLNRNRAVPLTYDQFRYGFANAVGEDEAREALRDLRRAGAGRAHLPGGCGQPESVDRGQGRQQESGAPRSGAAAAPRWIPLPAPAFGGYQRPIGRFRPFPGPGGFHQTSAEMVLPTVQTIR